jgi:hypothetical protein
MTVCESIESVGALETIPKLNPEPCRAETTNPGPFQRVRAVRVIAPLPVRLTDDTHAARADAAEPFALYGRLPSYRAMLDREGFAGPQDAARIGD